MRIPQVGKRTRVEDVELVPHHHLGRRVVVVVVGAVVLVPLVAWGGEVPRHCVRSFPYTQSPFSSSPTHHSLHKKA